MAEKTEKKSEGKAPDARATTRNWYGSGKQAPGKEAADAAATPSEPEDVPTRHRREREESWTRHDSEFSDMRKRHAKELAEILDRHSSEMGAGAETEEEA